MITLPTKGIIQKTQVILTTDYKPIGSDLILELDKVSVEVNIDKYEIIVERCDGD